LSAPEHRIADGVLYMHNPVHRNWKAGGKSQWTIPEAAERACFLRAYGNHWVLERAGWGLHLENGQPDYLGKGQDHQMMVFVAKFVNGSGTGPWHGYPADHCRTVGDIPRQTVAWDWYSRGLLTRPKVRKLLRGQPCSL
jgi:hypothetical protein